MPTGLGDEELWWCPTISAQIYTDESAQSHTVSQQGSATSLVTDTDAGGQYAGQFTTSGTVRVQVQFAFMSAGDSSVSGWIRAATADTCTVIAQQAGGANSNKSGIVLQQVTSQSRAFFRSGGTDANDLLWAGNTPPNSIWYHLVATREGSTCKIFVDGVFAATKTVTGYPPNPDLKNPLIGGFWNGSTPTANSTGYMDDIRVYDRALTQAEITHLATSRGVLGPPSGDNYSPFRNAKYINRTYQIPRFG